MKFSINSLKYFENLYKWSDEPLVTDINVLTDKIGSQLGEIEELSEPGQKYDKALIVRVVSCEKHPNADKLQICTIDDSGRAENVERLEDGKVRVVCGAPNARAGINVVWLPPGAIVPSTYSAEPFTLEAREIRGVMSQGMLASPKELALGDSHEGILEIDDVIEPGTPFVEQYNLLNDLVIAIENKMFTHRPDCFGWFGIARELAGIQGKRFKSPDWYVYDAEMLKSDQTTLPLTIRNDIPELVRRFMAVPVADVKVRPSPVWLQLEISRVGLRPINNIVDLTNFYMLLTGQPLHAYDYDKVRGMDGPDASEATIVIRYPESGEKLKLLNGKEIEPRQEAIMIASDNKLIGLGGVMGGADTEVDDSTRNIIVECASFDMYAIRKTSMEHGLFSDAVTRFNKGQSPLQNAPVLSKILEEIIKISGGYIAGDVVDLNYLPDEVMERGSLHPDVNVEVTFINNRLGLDITTEEVSQLLQNVEFQVELTSRKMVDETDGKRVDSQTLTIRAPFWRTDIETPEDIVEEVGRLYGFDKLPLELPTRSIIPARKDPGFTIRKLLRDQLSLMGANETLSYSFVHGQTFERNGQDASYAFKLSNALSPDLQYFRLSLTPSLLEKVQPNIRSGYDSFALYEIGKAHCKGLMDEAGLPAEFERLAFVVASGSKTSSRLAGAAYYQAKQYLQHLMEVFIEQDKKVSFVPLVSYDNGNHVVVRQLVAPYEPLRSAVVLLDDSFVGIVGEYRSSVRKALKLPAFFAGFEIDLGVFTQTEKVGYATVSKYPGIEQDICLRVPYETSYQSVYDALANKLAEMKIDNSVTSLSPIDIYQRPDESSHKQITLRYRIASYERTLTDAEVAHVLQNAATAAAEDLHAEIV